MCSRITLRTSRSLVQTPTLWRLRYTWRGFARLGTSGQSKLHQADSMPRGFVGCVRLEKALILSGAKRKHGQAPEGGLDRLWTDSGPTVARDAGRFEVDQRDGVGAPLFSLFDCGVLAESGPFTLLSPAPTFACRSWSVQLTVFTGGAMSPSSAWNRLSERRQRERTREHSITTLFHSECFTP